jgi:hypothetical protein
MGSTRQPKLRMGGAPLSSLRGILWRGRGRQTKAPPGAGLGGQVMMLAITGLPISPERKPTTPTPSRTVGCALRGGPARKSPCRGAGLVAYEGLPKCELTANPPRQYHSRCTARGRTRMKKPRRSGAKVTKTRTSAKPTNNQSAPRSFHPAECRSYSGPRQHFATLTRDHLTPEAGTNCQQATSTLDNSNSPDCTRSRSGVAACDVRN